MPSDELQAGPVAPTVEPNAIRTSLERFDFQEPMGFVEAIENVTGMLKDGSVHMMHPGYMGLFNPSAVFPGILADQIASSFNPQLAVWSHAPAAVEIERHTILAIGSLCGWGADKTAGHFTSGGAEANFTAVLMALTRVCPGFSDEGARAFSGQPRLYVSVESHLAWLQIAHRSGIGRGRRSAGADRWHRADGRRCARQYNPDGPASGRCSGVRRCNGRHDQCRHG